MTRFWLVVLALGGLTLPTLGRAAGPIPTLRDLYGDPLPPGAVSRLGTNRWHHEGGVAFVAFTPAGDRLVTARQSPAGRCTACHGHPFIPPTELPTPFTGTTFRVWDSRGQELAHFGEKLPNINQPTVVGSEGHLRAGSPRKPHPVVLASLSPDGKTLLTVEADNKLRLREIPSGREKARHPPGDLVLGACFTPDARAIAVHSQVQGLRLLKAKTGELIRKFDRGEDTPRLSWGDQVTFSSGGHLLAAGVTDATDAIKSRLLVFEAATGKEVWRTEERARGCAAFRFAPGGSVLAWPGPDGFVRLTDVRAGKEVKRLGGPGKTDYLASLAFSPDGKHLGTVGFDGSVRLWDVASGKERYTLRPGVRYAEPYRFGQWAISPSDALAFSPDGKTLAAGTPQGLVKFWDVASGNDLYPAHEGGLNGLAVSADGLTVTTHGADCTSRTWDLSTGRPLRRVALAAGTTNVVHSSDGRLAAFSLDRENLQLWDVAAGKRLRLLRSGPTRVGDCAGAKDSRTLVFAPGSPPGGNLLAELGPDGWVRVWDTTTGERQAEYQMPPTFGSWSDNLVEPFPRLAFGPGGRQLAILEGNEEESTHQYLHLLTLGRGQARLELKAQTNSRKAGPAESTPFAFSPDGRLLVMAEQQGTFRVWELASLTDRSWVAPTGKQFRALACSPRGALTAWGCSDGTIAIWDLWAGEKVGEFRSGQAGLDLLAFSADAKVLVSGASDGTALVWDLSSLEKRAGTVGAGLAGSDRLARLWQTLADAEARKAFEAMRELRDLGGPAVADLRRRMAPAPLPNEKALARWIEDLGSGEFERRSLATQELTKLGDLAGPALEGLLQRVTDLETRKRAQRLLAGLSSPRARSAEELRALRAVEVLERVGTPEAREALRSLGRGAPGARLTREALAALGRLGG
jgi:WD40 repeat protein